MNRWYVDIKKLRELWDSGMIVRDIAAALNTTPSVVYKLRVMYRMTPRKRSGKQTLDPTPDEIYEAAAAIRAKWSPERLAQSSHGSWSPPVV